MTTQNPMDTPEPLKPGYIRDYISGLPVKATPEETEAVQVFARRLVEDFGYPVSHIQTRPQFRVRARPSDEEKSYPIDIGVFQSEARTENHLFIIVECKKKNRRDGIIQLQLYLDMSPAEIGVWFNGDEHVYLRKIYHRDGSRTYDELPNIPRFGQRIEDIGLFQRQDLKKPSNLKAVFRDLRNHLAGMTTGITRDEALAQEIINILFCKIVDEQDREPDEIVTFRAGIGEGADVIQQRILALFERVKAHIYDDLFEPDDTIKLDAESLRYVVGELQNYCIMEADRDAIGDAFEVFIGPALRGSEGQFFTPRNVVKMMIDILDPRPGEMIIDPACGSGGFLIAALEHVWAKINADADRLQSKEEQRIKRRLEVAMRCFRGIDKDAFLAKVSKAYMALIGDGRGGVFCDNALARPEDWNSSTFQGVRLGGFDIVMTNPPFGTKIPIRGQQILSQYELGFKWKRNKQTGQIEKTTIQHHDQPPQVLFLERCLQFLKPGGRMGIVLPESIFGMPTYEYVIDYLRQRVKIRGIVSMPEPLFKTSGKGGTHAKVCILFIENTRPRPDKDYEIFMSDVKWCGHDSRGNPTLRKDAGGNLILLDEVPLVARRYKDIARPDGATISDRLGFALPVSSLKNNVFIPKYYDPEIESELNALKETHDLVSLGDLVAEKTMSWDTGIEVGKMVYGTGAIPFIRTSDISDWGLRGDPKQSVSEAIYQENKQDIRSEDIFVVRDGTYLVGSSCILTEFDTKILYCGGIYKLRIQNPERLDPYLLLALLNTPIVRKQMRAKQFTRDIIDTLGKRLFEVQLPIPKNRSLRDRITQETREIIQTRVRVRNRARELPLEIQGVEYSRPEEDLDEA